MSTTEAQDPEPAEIIAVGLTTESVEALVKLHGQTGLIRADLVNRAIQTYLFINTELVAGNTILIKNANGRMSSVSFE